MKTQVFGLTRIACESCFENAVHGSPQLIVKVLELRLEQFPWHKRMFRTGEQGKKTIPAVFASIALQPIVVVGQRQGVSVNAVRYVDHPLGLKDLPGFPGGPGR
jgi:hypothetical protein